MKNYEIFKKIFMEFGYSIKELPTKWESTKSAIFYNDTFAIAFTTDDSDKCTVASIVSYPRESLEWLENLAASVTSTIGYEAFSRYMNGERDGVWPKHYGPLCNHDHAPYEVRMALERTA